jgi:hypothetical protein
LEHDSHIACHEIRALKREEVIRELMSKPDAIKGNISANVRNQIVAAVKFAKTIEKDKKSRILAALESN